MGIMAERRMTQSKQWQAPSGKTEQKPCAMLNQEWIYVKPIWTNWKTSLLVCGILQACAGCSKREVIIGMPQSLKYDASNEIILIVECLFGQVAVCWKPANTVCELKIYANALLQYGTGVKWGRGSEHHWKGREYALEKKEAYITGTSTSPLHNLKWWKRLQQMLQGPAVGLGNSLWLQKWPIEVVENVSSSNSID